MCDFFQFVDFMVVRSMVNFLDRLSEEYKKKYVNKEENKKLFDELGDLMDKNNVIKVDERIFNFFVGYRIKNLEVEIVWEFFKLFFVKLSCEVIIFLVELIGLKEFGDLKE